MEGRLISSLAVAIFILLMGCTDFLEEEHPTKATGASSITDATDATLAANGLYVALNGDNGLNGLYGHDEPSLWYFDEMRGDDVTIDLGYLDRRADRCVKYYGFSYGEEEASIESLWEYLYEAIYHCNWVIESVEGNSALNQEVQEEVLSQAYFMRGFYHFTLVRLWGDVPLMLSTPADRDAFKPAKTDEEIVWESVLEDMEIAAAMTGLIPEVADGNGDKNKGYANEAVIHAMAARAYLYRPSGDKTADYRKVEEHAMEVINMGMYELEDPYTNLFSTDDDFWQTKNSEVIWHRGAASTFSLNDKFLDINSRLSLRSAPPGITAARALVTTTGIFAGSRPGRAIWASSPEIAQMMQEAFDNDGDLRITETFYYPTYNHYTNAADNIFDVIDSRTGLNDWLSDRSTGAPLYFYKFRYSNTEVIDAQEMIYNSVTPSIIRYADVLLMLAEAKARLGEAQSSVVDGKTPLQAVMERAGLTTGWESPTVDVILEQRRKELVGEWLRVPDLIRLRQLEQAHTRKAGALTDNYTLPWQEKFNYLPIPRRELELNENLTQHELWR